MLGKGQDGQELLHARPDLSLSLSSTQEKADFSKWSEVKDVVYPHPLPNKHTELVLYNPNHLEGKEELGRWSSPFNSFCAPVSSPSAGRDPPPGTISHICTPSPCPLIFLAPPYSTQSLFFGWEQEKALGPKAEVDNGRVHCAAETCGSYSSKAVGWVWRINFCWCIFWSRFCWKRSCLFNF